ncbi:hypothetical protein TWF225_001338 [Orbilia oligospora]|uniref:Uncharacterized protein n=1 Tax=Orbilia oligospora TaxID=2813651 RepID=A0A7C8PGR0_ORBOL|nr:hypothetical protein TWF751_008875 [Orbilia oligospora]KAF3191177.1 hypothetical protein TWF225_001338 [Orbilia oligospora]KAF3238699.1 hypothetical protein TWF128_011954 [Orbilia oligospora]KAF3249670.1 hypothetical protein TWF217_008863 [Orbilia oligospora]KAF3279281.1 hypothetical protein TWF132_000648 [Orbilia oligospora]
MRRKVMGIFVDILKLLPMQCRGVYGVNKNICTLRCENEAKNGPFGSCWPVKIEPPPGLNPPWYQKPELSLIPKDRNQYLSMEMRATTHRKIHMMKEQSIIIEDKG